jgi:Uma2 family endonuclease
MTPGTKISVEQYQAEFANEHGVEYWFGEVVRKGLGTKRHGILQALLIQLLFEAGYIASSEVDLRISRHFQPRPDVMGDLDPDELGYPTKPFDIVAEVLSPDDSPQRVLEKCQHYTELGIAQIYVFDPVERTAQQWNASKQVLEEISVMKLTNGRELTTQAIWQAFDLRLRKRS